MSPDSVHRIFVRIRVEADSMCRSNGALFLASPRALSNSCFIPLSSGSVTFVREGGGTSTTQYCVFFRAARRSRFAA